MIKDLSITSGIIASVFILLYSFLFILRDLYLLCKNNNIKKFINRILPFFTKYNPIFLLLSVLFSLYHICSFSTIDSTLSFGYAIIVLIFIIIKIKFFPSKKSNSSQLLNYYSYLLVISLLFHIFLY